MRAPVQFPYFKDICSLAKSKKRHLYLVGGALRDFNLGREVSDFDFAIDRDAIAFARAFARKIKGAFVLLDDVHGSARIVRNSEDVIYTFDFTDFRGKTIEEDLSRRDFTVNTFCMDVLNNKDCSPASAQKDLNAKIIRMTSSKAFIDDPLRLLRAFSLFAQTGFKIDVKTLARIKKDAHLINSPAMERVHDEIFKILHSSRTHGAFLAMDKIELLTKVIPQLSVMKGVYQGGYHHLDVWKHSLEVLNQAEQLISIFEEDKNLNVYLNQAISGGTKRKALLKFAALLHDIGKPATRKKEGARMTFHSHEHAGAQITRLVAKRLKLSVKQRHWLEDAVTMHLRPGYLSNFKVPSKKAVFRYMRDTKEEAPAIAILAMSDQRATCGLLTTQVKAKHHDNICRMIIAEYFKEEIKPKKERLITGNDLIKHLKLKPSPVFAEILTAVEEAQALGVVTNKQEALSLARKIAKV